MSDLVCGGYRVSNLEIDCSVEGPEQQAEHAGEIVNRHGVVVLRGAYSPLLLEELFDSLSQCRDEAMKHIRGDGSPKFGKKYDFKENGMSLELAAADPWTDYQQAHEGNGDQTRSTSLFNALQSGPGWTAIKSIIPSQFFCQVVRVRIIDFRAGTPQDRRGALFFHQEKWGIKDKGVPLGHNIWILLNPNGETANEDTAGLQFALGDRRGWLETALSDYEETSRQRLTRLNQASRSCDNADAPLIELDGHVLFRPKIDVGDVIVFDHHIPHASFVPTKASAVRISCDLRLFPMQHAVNWAH